MPRLTIYRIYLHRSSIELLGLRDAKQLWSAFGCQVLSNPIRKDHWFPNPEDIAVDHSYFADDPQTRRLVYTITFLTCAKRTSRSTKHLEPVSTSYNYQPNRKLIPKNRGDACASKPPMHTTTNNLCYFPIIICHLGMLFDDPPLKGRKRRKTNRMTQP